MSKNSLREWIPRYLAMGFTRLIPLRRGARGTYKEPKVKKWAVSETEPLTEQELIEYANQRGTSGLAAVLGPDRVAVTDFDKHRGGLDIFNDWFTQHRPNCDECSALPVVKTGRDGRHVYHNISDDCITNEDLGYGEVKVRNVLIALAGSYTPTGLYEYIHNEPPHLRAIPTINPYEHGLAIQDKVIQR